MGRKAWSKGYPKRGGWLDSIINIPVLLFRGAKRLEQGENFLALYTYFPSFVSCRRGEIRKSKGGGIESSKGQKICPLRHNLLIYRQAWQVQGRSHNFSKSMSRKSTNTKPMLTGAQDCLNPGGNRYTSFSWTDSFTSWKLNNVHVCLDFVYWKYLHAYTSNLQPSSLQIHAKCT